PSARVHILPCIAGHVGADHVAVLLAEAPHQQDKQMLVIDVGTNAEMSLGGREKVLCASSPTGPAFEGAQITHGQRAASGAIERVRIDPDSLQPRYRVIGHDEWIDGDSAAELPASARATGICGSGIIEIVAELFLAGVLRPDGRFDETAAERSSRVRFPGRSGEYLLVDAAHSAGGAAIIVTQSDVRAIQLAKAALYAGVKLLMQHQGISRVDGIRLAGAFGSYIDPLHAMVLGMIPDCPLEDVQAVGNAAGDGARIALLNLGQRAEAARISHWVQHIQTATEPSFQDEFMGAIALPHATDKFTHLEEILSSRPSDSRPRRAAPARGKHHSKPN
ncbi:MAG: ASKHA domain-containing protein, partial [Chloroflexi bacterium]|nr:ASKHA domain-containing protein [Chloroflexota bacterium]